VPLILAAFGLYLLLFWRPALRGRWAGLAQLLGLTVALALPLLWILSRQPGSETRVAEVGRPLAEALAGNLGPLWENSYRTLAMFHSDGDDEWLYNIPFRPLFNGLGAIIFWAGVLIALLLALRPPMATVVARLGRPKAGDQAQAPAAAFVLIWWLAGIAPGFLSVPAGSLSHTIVAQPAVYILAALPVGFIARSRRWAPVAPLLAAIVLLGIARRDLPDYFRVWPERGNVRFLYRADIGDVADYLARQGQPADFAISGLLAGPWDREALTVELAEAGAEPSGFSPRWYNPTRAAVLELEGRPAIAFTGYPVVEDVYAAIYSALPAEGIGGYHLSRVTSSPTLASLPQGETCFENGLCVVAASFDPASGRLQLGWRLARRLDLPPTPLISNPPPPGVYSGPRLLVFAHLLDSEQAIIIADDGLWLDPTGLRPGDLFVQDHYLTNPGGREAAQIAFGLYDPFTGARILTEDRQERVELPASAGGEP
jgi:hypothetical protein